MDPSTTSITNLAVGGAVGAAMKILMMFGITGRFATSITLWLVAAIVGLYAYTHENHFERIMLWTYFVMYLDMMTASVAGFHGTEEAVKAAQRNNLL